MLTPTLFDGGDEGGRAVGLPPSAAALMRESTTWQPDECASARSTRATDCERVRVVASPARNRCGVARAHAGTCGGVDARTGMDRFDVPFKRGALRSHALPLHRMVLSAADRANARGGVDRCPDDGVDYVGCRYPDRREGDLARHGADVGALQQLEPPTKAGGGRSPLKRTDPPLPRPRPTQPSLRL